MAQNSLTAWCFIHLSSTSASKVVDIFFNWWTWWHKLFSSTNKEIKRWLFGNVRWWRWWERNLQILSIDQEIVSLGGCKVSSICFLWWNNAISNGDYKKTVCRPRPVMLTNFLCNLQACSFRDSYEKFKKAGAEVIGISGDDPSSHKVKQSSSLEK